MDLFAIWKEQEGGSTATAAHEGYVNPAAMDDWAADSIEARAAVKGGE